MKQKRKYKMSAHAEKSRKRQPPPKKQQKSKQNEL